MPRVLPLALLALVTASVRAQEKITFQKHIKPIFEANCNKCHNADETKGDVNLTSVAAILGGGASGAIAMPGDAKASSLYLTMAHLAEPYMPQRASKRPDAELELVKKWIEGGLLDTETSVALKPKASGLDLGLVTVSPDKPDGPPPMPEDLLLEPVVHTARANALTALAHSPWAPLLAVGSQRQTLLYHTDTFDLLGVLPFPEGNVFSVRFSRNGAYLVAAGGVEGKSGRATLYEVRTGKPLITVGDDYDSVLAADLSPDQRLIATGGTDKFVKIYDLRQNKQVHKIKKHTEWVTALAFSPDGVLIATGDRNGGVHVWESGTGQEFYSLRGHSSGITGLSWRRDSNLLASSSEDGTVRIWKMDDGNEGKRWEAHGKRVLAVDFAPDGSVITCGKDNTARRYKADGAETAKYEGFADLPVAVVASHDGKRVIAGDWTGHLSVFDAESKQRLAHFVAAPPTLEVRLADARAAFEKEKASVTARRGELDGKRKAEGETLARQQKAEALHAEKVKAVVDGKAKAQELEQLLATAGSARGEAEKALQELDGRVEARRQELAAWEKERTEKQAAAAAPAPADLPADQAQARVEGLKKEVADLAARLEAGRAELTGWEKDRQGRVEAVAAREKAAAEAKAALDALRPQIDAWRAERGAAEKEKQELAGPLDTARKEREAAEKALAEAEARQAEAERQIKRWELARFNVEVQAARLALAEKEAAIRAHEAAILDQQAALQQAASDRAAAEGHLQKLQAEYSARKGG
jgi:hypothetical protein